MAAKLGLLLVGVEKCSPHRSENTSWDSCANQGVIPRRVGRLHWRQVSALRIALGEQSST